ncbi:hypothetical protein DFP72DRAFT_1084557 [Ephemerocybe angulata]|uniref:Methyltransferase type 12 domain-containing protein n=1 Tax=Ephemerocybe angulata TaxID=980116 RepID=A0A8H6LT32_9AGAR|nr:hypothetical protein DFP72DRAFT_1084557 [Tulosesus angulatus]
MSPFIEDTSVLLDNSSSIKGIPGQFDQVSHETTTYNDPLGREDLNEDAKEPSQPGPNQLQSKSYSDLVCTAMMNGKAEVKNVLHLGCGTVEWIKAVAQDFPRCQAVALDVAPGNERLLNDLPSNVRLEIDNLDYGLQHFFDAFDVVSIRFASLRARGYQRLLVHASRALRQNGVLEVWECDLFAYNQDHEPISANIIDPLGTYPWWATFLAYIRQAVDVLGGSVKAASTMGDWITGCRDLGNVRRMQIWVPVALGDSQAEHGDANTCQIMKDHLAAIFDLSKPLLLGNGLPISLYNMLVDNVRQELQSSDRLQYARVYSVQATKCSI